MTDKFSDYSSKYMNELVRLRCGGDLLNTGFYPNAKELTESFAAYHAVRHYLPDFEIHTKRVVCVVVGDGVTPRTGTVMAYRTKWDVISLDPRMRPIAAPVRRLMTIHRRIQEAPLNFDAFKLSHRVLAIAVHAHINLNWLLKYIWPLHAVVAMPCCVKQTRLRGRLPDISFVDHHIWSPQNKIHIWKDLAKLPLGG